MGGIDNNNILCLLSNNAFNQHYFFLPWVWWTALLVLSGLTFIYSLIKLTVPQVSSQNFKRTLSMHGVDLGQNQLNGLSHYDFYLLGRIASNLREARFKLWSMRLEPEDRDLHLRWSLTTKMKNSRSRVMTWRWRRRIFTSGP